MRLKDQQLYPTKPSSLTGKPYPSPAMTWRSWRYRLSSTPLLLLLATSGFAFFLGLFTSAFFSEIFYSNAVSADHDDKIDPRFFRMLPVDFITFRKNCTDGEVPADNVREFIIDTIFDGASPFDNFPSPETATLLRKKRIKGWGSEASVFERLIREVRPTVIVELGSFLGASAIHMGQVARNLSLNPIILCVDDFRGWPEFRSTKFQDIKLLNGNNMLYYQFMKNVQFSNLTESILPVPFSTTGAVMKFCEWGVRPDLVEVDAAHDFHSTWVDLNLAYATLRPGGVMFGHDYYNRANAAGVRRAVDLFAKLNNLKVEPDGKHWILRNSSYVFP